MFRDLFTDCYQHPHSVEQEGNRWLASRPTFTQMRVPVNRRIAGGLYREGRTGTWDQSPRMIFDLAGRPSLSSGPVALGTRSRCGGATTRDHHAAGPDRDAIDRVRPLRTAGGCPSTAQRMVRDHRGCQISASQGPCCCDRARAADGIVVVDDLNEPDVTENGWWRRRGRRHGTICGLGSPREAQQGGPRAAHHAAEQAQTSLRSARRAARFC